MPAVNSTGLAMGNAAETSALPFPLPHARGSGNARVVDATPPTDAELVAQTLAGDKSAFEELVRRHEGPVYARLLRMTGRMEDAEDIAQEVFLRAWRSLHTFDPQYPFSAWINRIAWNAGLSAMKAMPRHAALDDGCEPEAPHTWSPLHAASLGELRARLFSAAASLPDETAEVFRLRYEEDLSLREIAQRHGRTENSVAVILHRARKELRRLLAQPGGKP